MNSFMINFDRLEICVKMWENATEELEMLTRKENPFNRLWGRKLNDSEFVDLVKIAAYSLIESSMTGCDDIPPISDLTRQELIDTLDPIDRRRMMRLINKYNENVDAIKLNQNLCATYLHDLEKMVNYITRRKRRRLE